MKCSVWVCRQDTAVGLLTDLSLQWKEETKAFMAVMPLNCKFCFHVSQFSEQFVLKLPHCATKQHTLSVVFEKEQNRKLKAERDGNVAGLQSGSVAAVDSQS